MPTRDMNEVRGIKRECTVRILCLAGRGGGDVDFCKRTNKRDRMEGITGPHHCETVGNRRNQMRSIGTLELNALVEIINGLPKPHTNDQKRGDSCRNSFQSEFVEVSISMAYRS